MLEIRLLGQFDLRLDGAAAEIASRPAQALVANLALNAGKPQRRERVAGLVWPEATEDNARTYLRQALWRVRKAIGEAYFLADRMTITFDLEADYWLDVKALESEPAGGWTAGSLISAVSVYEGELLPGFYDDWIMLERERVAGMYDRRMDTLLNELMVHSRWEDLLVWGERWIAMGSAPEPAYRALMKAHAALGDLASMSAAYRRCVEALQAELGVEPSEETHKLYLRLAKRDKSTLASIESARLHQAAEEKHSRLLLKREMEQEIRFFTSHDGVRIAYATIGEGPALVRAATYMTHLEYDWSSPLHRHWLEGLSTYHTFVRYDQRGSGLSDWDVEDFSLDARVQDLEMVVGTLDLDRFSLLGISQGGPVAIAYAVRHPEKVSHLILFGTYARGLLAYDPTPEQLEEAETLVKLIKLGWGRDDPTFRQIISTYFLPEGTPEQISWFDDLQRISTPPEIAAKFQAVYNTIDVSDLATRVAVPTLVLHARHDLGVPFKKGRELAALIPNARLVSLEGKNHLLLASETAWPRFLAEVHRFLGTTADNG